LEHLVVVVREIEVEEMGDDPLARDARIKLTIGTKKRRATDGPCPVSLAFDHRRGLLLVSDAIGNVVHVYSYTNDGSPVSKLGKKGSRPGHFQNIWGLAIDHDNDRILIVDSANYRVQSWSLSEQSFLSCIGQHGSGGIKLNYPHGIAIDKHHRRIVIADTHHNRLVFLSSIDLSLLFSVGKEGTQPGEFDWPFCVAIDDDRQRVIVVDSLNHRVQVLSSIDGSFLFEFGSEGNQPGQFKDPHGVCVDNQGRIIVTDFSNCRLQAFTHEGHHISSFNCGREKPLAVAFDEHRGLIAFSAGHRVHVIGANQWLPDTKFTWRPERHRDAPSSMKRAVSTMTMIRSLADESDVMSMIPNELLFEIFSYL